MDPRTPDFATDIPPAGDPFQPGFSDIFINRLLRRLATTLPFNMVDHPDEFAEEWEAARELFFSLHPRNPAEAVLAARAVASHYRGMDMFARAAQPGTSDEKALRLGGSAIAATRSFDAALRTLEKLQKPARPEAAPKRAAAPRRSPTAAPPAAAPQPDEVTPPGYVRLAPGATPIPHIELFHPRDHNGEVIPGWRYEWMTMKQRRAAYSYPRNAEFEAEAIAEEDAIIAAHLGQQSAAQLPPSAPDAP